MICSTVKEMYEVLENGLDATCVSELLNHFLQHNKQAQKSSGSLIAAWSRFLKVAIGHWMILTEKWREITEGIPQISLTVSSESRMFLRKYFLFYASTNFSDPEHQDLCDAIKIIVDHCRLGSLIDDHKLKTMIKAARQADWTNYYSAACIFPNLDDLEKMKTIDSFIPNFQPTRLG